MGKEGRLGPLLSRTHRSVSSLLFFYPSAEARRLFGGPRSEVEEEGRPPKTLSLFPLSPYFPEGRAGGGPRRRPDGRTDAKRPLSPFLLLSVVRRPSRVPFPDFPLEDKACQEGWGRRESRRRRMRREIGVKKGSSPSHLRYTFSPKPFLLYFQAFCVSCFTKTGPLPYASSKPKVVQ